MCELCKGYHVKFLETCSLTMIITHTQATGEVIGPRGFDS